MDATTATATMKSSQVKEGSMHSVTLVRALNMDLLPTPTTHQQHTKFKQGKTCLQAYFTKMLPTATSRDWKGGRTKEALQKANRTETNSLPDYFAQSGKTSQLNPLFVMEMMGVPPNWTELPFLSGENKA